MKAVVGEEALSSEDLVCINYRSRDIVFDQLKLYLKWY
jgi:hypothetical protein